MVINLLSEVITRDSHDEVRGGVVPEEVRVLRLLAREGRVRQSWIPAHMEWSVSKTSRVLTRMEDANLIERVYVGTGKVVFLPTHPPEELPEFIVPWEVWEDGV